MKIISLVSRTKRFLLLITIYTSTFQVYLQKLATFKKSSSLLLWLDGGKSDLLNKFKRLESGRSDLLNKFERPKRGKSDLSNVKANATCGD